MKQIIIIGISMLILLTGCVQEDYISNIELDKKDVYVGDEITLYFDIHNPHNTYKKFMIAIYSEDVLNPNGVIEDDIVFNETIAEKTTKKYFQKFTVQDIPLSQDVTQLTIQAGLLDKKDQIKHSDFILIKPKPKELTCYNSSYNIYHGEINDTCYFFGCKSECEIDMIRQMDWDSLKYAVWDYNECLEYCLEDIEIENMERYFAHEWKCIINETVEVIQEERCY